MTGSTLLLPLQGSLMALKIPSRVKILESMRSIFQNGSSHTL